MPRTGDGQNENSFGPCKVVLLAGGLGTRLAEQTDDLPKPMVEIGGRPMLWHIMNIYSHFGCDDFLVACGYRAQVIKRFFLEYREQVADLVIDYVRDRIDYQHRTNVPWRVGLVDTGLQTQTGGRLRRLAPHLRNGSAGGSTFLMTYGDGLADVDIRRLLEFHRGHGRLATFTAVRPPSPFGRPQIDGDRVTSFEEKPMVADERINGGFFALQTEILDLIENDETSFEMVTLPRLAAEGELMAFRHDGFWHPMDTLRDVRNLNAMWADGQPPWKVWEA